MLFACGSSEQPVEPPLIAGATLEDVSPDGTWLAYRDAHGLSVMEIVHGLIPDMSITQTLTRLVRDDVARERVVTGRRIEAAEALELGLVTRISEAPEEDARELAAEIAARRPEAVRNAKRLLNEAPTLSPAEALALETELQRELLGVAPRA